ncbi:MAG: sugar phosphate isomerase/epimerase [Candidatus Bathyarchaeota archaeon]|nr:MAG: sugar phosphate isomerase/epimerase [Candidatus Bathyarchaeota archaeon]
MKLGYSTWGMPTVSVATSFKYLADLGFDGVELTVIPGYTTELRKLNTRERRHIQQLLSQHRLMLSAISAHSNLVSHDHETYTTNVTRLKGAIDLAAELAQDKIVPVVISTSGNSLQKWDAIKDLLVERTRKIVEYAETQHVTFAVEPHIGAVIDTPQKMLQLLKFVDSPHLKVNLDISHFDVMGLSNEETIDVLESYIVHTHVKDQCGHVPDFEFRIPGEGTFDYVQYLKALRNANYDGFITVEISVMVQRRPNYDPFAAATLSYQTLTQAFTEAGIPRK